MDLGIWSGAGKPVEVILQMCQISHNILAIEVFAANYFAPYRSRCIDDVGFWKHDGPIKIRRFLGRVPNCEQVNLVVTKEFVVGILVLVHTHGQDGDVLSHPSLQLGERRHFLNARDTVGGPKVQYHWLPFEIMEGHSAIRVADGKIRRRIANQAWL